MNLHEYQGKQLLEKFNVSIQRGYVANNPDEAVECAKKLSNETGTEIFVVKAQIHAGGRGKGGGVEIAKSLDEVRSISSEIIGINILHAKISAFAISSYVIGVSGAMLVFFWKGAAEANLFDIGLSFRILFMVIIGGLGSVLGAFFGAFFIVVLPVLINVVPQFMGLAVASETVEHVNLIIIGSLIIAILIIEPHGLSRLWSIGREKLRLWPFPH